MFLGPDDADELIDLLTDAATVTGVLAGHPAAEAALAADGTGPARDCAELTIDLRLAAARAWALERSGTLSGVISTRRYSGRAGYTATSRSRGTDHART